MNVIIDYGMGNLRSIQKNILRLGHKVEISSNPHIIYKAEKLILPGVGHFAKGMENIKKLGIVDLLNEKVLVKKTPILGICLGMQLLSKKSEEGSVAGFCWLNGETVKFKVSDKLKYKIPHMGWNNVELLHPNPLFKNVDVDAQFYFVHSYHWKSYEKGHILTTTKYDYEFVSAVNQENIYGTQFHPEKSHSQGMQILKNFIELI